jgi:hypothetical protein
MHTRQVVRSLLLLAVSVTAVVVVITVYQVILLGGIGTLRAVVDEPPQVTPPPQPRLEITNGEVLNILRAQEVQRLNNYTWIDQAAGTVVLPVERAIELTLERGLPVREQPEGQAPPGVTLPQGSSSGRTLERIP